MRGLIRLRTLLGFRLRRPLLYWPDQFNKNAIRIYGVDDASFVLPCARTTRCDFRKKFNALLRQYVNRCIQVLYCQGDAVNADMTDWCGIRRGWVEGFDPLNYPQGVAVSIL